MVFIVDSFCSHKIFRCVKQKICIVLLCYFASLRFLVKKMASKVWYTKKISSALKLVRLCPSLPLLVHLKLTYFQGEARGPQEPVRGSPLRNAEDVRQFKKVCLCQNAQWVHKRLQNSVICFNNFSGAIWQMLGNLNYFFNGRNMFATWHEAISLTYNA